jgi:hypothetical protein
MMKFRDGRSHPGTIHGILTKDDSLDQWVLLISLVLELGNWGIFGY